MFASTDYTASLIFFKITYWFSNGIPILDHIVTLVLKNWYVLML